MAGYLQNSAERQNTFVGRLEQHVIDKVNRKIGSRRENPENEVPSIVQYKYCHNFQLTTMYDIFLCQISWIKQCRCARFHHFLWLGSILITCRENLRNRFRLNQTS